MGKTHFKQLTDSNYLGSWDLLNKNDEYVKISAVITEIKKEEVHDGRGGKDTCIVAYLKGYKPMILNSTNMKMIAKVTASEFVDDWIGKTINIEVQKVKAFGGVHNALRVTKVLPELNEAHPLWDKIKTAIVGGKTTIEKIKAKYSINESNEKLLCSK